MAARMFAFQTQDEDEIRRKDPEEEKARQERLMQKHHIKHEQASGFNSSFLGDATHQALQSGGENRGLAWRQAWCAMIGLR